MQRKDQQQSCSAANRRTGGGNDAITDSMLKNILVMGTSNLTATAAANDQKHVVGSSLSQQKDMASDEFAEFQSCPKMGAFTNNGCSNAFDDFSDFITAVDPISSKPLPHHAPTDRYGAFRELDSKPNDYAFINEPPVDSDDRIYVWKQCLIACKQIMHKSFNALIVSHGEESAIEALHSEPGSVFVQDLHQLYLMTLRIRRALTSSCLKSEELNSLLTDVEMTWRPLLSLFDKAAPLPVSSSIPSSVAQNEHCHICLSSEPPDLVAVNATAYHTCCANLWIHCINSTLPRPK